MSRHTYAWGYKTREAAEDALEDMFAFDEVSQCSRPQISAYKTRNVTTGAPVVRYQITLQETSM